MFPLGSHLVCNGKKIPNLPKLELFTHQFVCCHIALSTSNTSNTSSDTFYLKLGKFGS